MEVSTVRWNNQTLLGIGIYFSGFNMARKKLEISRDMMVYYNNCDIVQFLDAIEKQFLFYKSKKLNLFKDGITVPGLTLKYLISI